MMVFIKSHIVLILVAGWLALSAVSCSPKSPEYVGIENFQLHSIGLKKSVVSADLKYFNPNNFGIQLRKAEADIYVNGVKSGRSILDTLIEISKKDTFFLPVEVAVDMKDVFPNALDILLTREVKLKIIGTAYLRKEGINFSIPIRYEGVEKIK
jgi:LEA14-like dessication related protein